MVNGVVLLVSVEADEHHRRHVRLLEGLDQVFELGDPLQDVVGLARNVDDDILAGEDTWVMTSTSR